MVDRFHMNGDHPCLGPRTAHGYNIFRRHGDGSAGEKPCTACIDHDHVRFVLLQRNGYFRAQNGVACDIESRFTVRGNYEALNGSHFLSDFPAPVPAAGAM